MRARPLVHCFGHIHEGYGAQRIAWGRDAEDVSTKEMSMSQLMQWAEKGEGRDVEVLEADMEKARWDRCVRVDVSEGGKRPLQRGKESLLVNAAVLDERYKAVNAPWLVDVDLPRA